jgi:hypothetical protein
MWCALCVKGKYWLNVLVVVVCMAGDGIASHVKGNMYNASHAEGYKFIGQTCSKHGMAESSVVCGVM